MSKIAIIGGGIIGSSIAWNLAKSGLTSELIVIEPDPTYEFAATPRAIGGIRFVQGLIENLKILSGENNLSLYKFGKNQAKHYFCSSCGIYTHHRSFTSPNKYCINLGCIDKVDCFKLKTIPIFDGKKI